MKAAELTQESMSAYDKAQILKRGQGALFTYNDVVFRVEKNGGLFIIEDTESGHKATDYSNPTNLIDFQGAAACLLSYNRSIEINKQGDVIK